MFNNTQKYTYLAIIFFFTIFTHKDAFCVEFYEIEKPYRKHLNQQYNYDVDGGNQTNQILDMERITDVYTNKYYNLYADEKKTNEKLEKDKEEESMSKRQKFKQQSNEKVETQITQKTTKKSWVEEWLPNTSVLPMTMVGAYTTFKLWLTIPSPTSISAKETAGSSDNYTTTQLFTGKAKYNIMPSMFIAIGNDKFKCWRWEIELGYLPILARNTGELTSDDAISEYTFYLQRKDLSMHLLTLSVNNFLQHEFFNKHLVGFIGLGIGVRYAWSMGSTLSSDFVLPVVTGHLGISFMLGKKSKINIAYTLMYSRISLPNKYSFDRINGYGVDGSNRAIQSGTLKFEQMLINGFSFEYLFYTA